VIGHSRSTRITMIDDAPRHDWSNLHTFCDIVVGVILQEPPPMWRNLIGQVLCARTTNRFGAGPTK
jgi:hypothetical protein